MKAYCGTGFCNRVNCLISAILNSDGQIDFHWPVNRDLPFEYQYFFKCIPGVKFFNIDNKYKTKEQPEGFFGSHTIKIPANKTIEDARNVSIFVKKHINLFKEPPIFDIGLHVRSFNTFFSNHNVKDFLVRAERFLEAESGNNEGRGKEVFFLYDHLDQNLLEKVNFKYKKKICGDIQNDYDRFNLLDMQKFIYDWATLSNCKTILTQNFHSTILDFAALNGSKIYRMQENNKRFLGYNTCSLEKGAAFNLFLN